MTEGLVGHDACAVAASVGAICYRIASGEVTLRIRLEPLSSASSTLDCGQVLIARSDLITEAVLAIDVVLGHSNQSMALRGGLVSFALRCVIELIGIVRLIVGIGGSSLPLRAQLLPLASFRRSLRQRGQIIVHCPVMNLI